MDASITVEPGVLYVVATPIGNLQDLSARALMVLRAVDKVLAEDTRHSARLLSHYGIRGKLLSLHEHNEQQRIPGLLESLRQGQSLALISDAGTPLISDPGFLLLRALHQAQLRVVPIPGPCSPMVALSAAGLPTDRFAFEGFLPARAGPRDSRLKALVDYPHTLVFLESNHRIQATLAAMVKSFGGTRTAAVARELTKLHEEIRRSDLADLAEYFADPQRCRGEFVVMVAGAEVAADIAQARLLLEALLPELPPTRAAAVASRITGMPKNRLYQLALSLQEEAEPD